jgi:hypothetical protein
LHWVQYVIAMRGFVGSMRASLAERAKAAKRLVRRASGNPSQGTTAMIVLQGSGPEEQSLLPAIPGWNRRTNKPALVRDEALR